MTWAADVIEVLERPMPMSNHDASIDRCRYCEMPTILDEGATLHLKWCPNHQASTCERVHKSH